ncbi:hypothetical protein LCGC14_1423960 [marine sediment metagenome]|uniref:Uncharacterized protein n=1 Tax=marine sediment metagenome TaxID=412755 RepID=A0A0F9M5Z6_9ZZZZ
MEKKRRILELNAELDQTHPRGYAFRVVSSQRPGDSYWIAMVMVAGEPPTFNHTMQQAAAYLLEKGCTGIKRIYGMGL